MTIDGVPATDSGAFMAIFTFSDDMRGIEATDFAVHGATIAVVAAGSKAVYDLSVSGEDVVPVRAASDYARESLSDLGEADRATPRRAIAGLRQDDPMLKDVMDGQAPAH